MDVKKNESKYIRVKERVEKLKKFYSNLTSYVVVITGLAVLNYYVNEWCYMWFLWVAFVWGVVILFHAIDTFDLNPIFGRDWEERKIKEYMNRDDDQIKWK